MRPSESENDSRFGFALPEDRAPLVGEEIYQGVKAAIQAIKNTKNKKNQCF